ncbi:MAG: CHAT domain-containing protein [Fischerella sp. CENA71]|nr:CHAT domain-containing protein [Fischerella sp. CENA71]
MRKIGKWLWNASKRVLVEVLPPFPLVENEEKYYTLLQQKGLGEESKVYLQFLLKVLRATADLLFLVKAQRATVHGRYEEAIDSLLDANTEKLNLTLAEVLRCWASAALAEVETYTAQKTAKVIFNFSNRISEFSLGDKASNMEIAITGYEIVLTVFTQQASPKEWAMTQNNLAYAYVERRLGKHSENIEQVINCFQEALKVYTSDTDPQQWAVTQNILSAFYLDRKLGKRAQNLELAMNCCQEVLKVVTFDVDPKLWAITQNNLGNVYKEKKLEEEAITCYQKALKVFTYEASPYAWADMQYKLGNAYREKRLGEQAQNLELAIDYYKEALKVFTFEAYRQQWADTQNELANAYSKRIIGDQAQNLEQAIACCREALNVYTLEDFPRKWAFTQNHLGNAYTKRILGKPTQNLEKAINCFNDALKVYTFDDDRQDWAVTQNNLGSAYRERRLEEQAIKCHQEALKVFTFDDYPQQWAGTQNNLATAYSGIILGDRSENLKQAIDCWKEALKVFTFENFRYEWALTQNNLAATYLETITEKQAENLDQAINCCKEALKVFTFDGFPQNHAECWLLLGFAYQKKNELASAYDGFKSAIDTVETLRSEIVSGEESKRKQAERFNQVYSCMVEVCLELGKVELGKITEAIEYVERSKTRNLVEQILERDSKTIFSPEDATKLEKYRDEIATGQYQIQNGKAENPKVLAQHLQQLRQQRNELQNRYLRVGYGFKFDSVHTALDEHTAIIEWYILDEKLIAFIVTHKAEVTIWQSQPKDQDDLRNWINQYLRNYYNQKDQWQNRLEEELKELASILHIDEILTQIPNCCDKLILIPHQFLHLFPLHALPVMDFQEIIYSILRSNITIRFLLPLLTTLIDYFFIWKSLSQNYEISPCLMDLFAGGVSYAPSCQLLQQVQKRDRPDFQSLFAIQNPTGDLNYTDLEVQIIQSYFNPAKVLKKTAATLTAINNSDVNTYHCAHFSCHGYFNLTNPGKSALILADAPIADTPRKTDSERYLNLRAGKTHDLEKCLTLDKIFSFKLEKCRLVTLSACETGLIDFQNTSDEYIGLPSGFLLAGSPSVVSSLWKVDDLSTSFLMIKFYENLVKLDNLEAGDIAIALKQAQNWLRNLTIEGLDQFLEEHKPQIETVLAQLRVGKRIRFQESLKLIKQRQPLPFANPYYWAGFIASGL